MQTELVEIRFGKHMAMACMDEEMVAQGAILEFHQGQFDSPQLQVTYPFCAFRLGTIFPGPCVLLHVPHPC